MAAESSARYDDSSHIAVMLAKTFGSRALFETTLSDTCMKGASVVPTQPAAAHAHAVFGSGWCWLQLCGGRVAVTATANQVSPVQQRCRPLLGIDVWGKRPRFALALLLLFVLALLFTSAAEHAYYLKHANKRAPYVANMLQIINVRPPVALL